jgi:outer membrane protein TolC
LESAIAEAWSRRPESARYDALTARQEVSVELAENQRAPRIDFGIGASLDVGTGTEAQQEVLGPAVLEASLTFALPLQNRSARGDVARTRAELSGLSAEARLVKDRVEARVRDTYSAVRAAEESVTLAREAAEVASAVAAAERTRFELGATELFVVNLREEAAAAAEAVVVDAEASVHVARAAFRAATGELGR